MYANVYTEPTAGLQGLFLFSFFLPCELTVLLCVCRDKKKTSASGLQIHTLRFSAARVKCSLSLDKESSTMCRLRVTGVGNTARSAGIKRQEEISSLLGRLLYALKASSFSSFRDDELSGSVQRGGISWTR